jgi:hypothetical protein
MFLLQYLGDSMAIYFNIDEERNHLLKNGVVYILRDVRKEGQEQVRKSKNSSFYPFEILGYANVKLINKIENLYDLKDYVTKSGFKTIDNWLLETKEDRYLYEVKMIK